MKLAALRNLHSLEMNLVTLWTIQVSAATSLPNKWTALCWLKWPK